MPELTLESPVQFVKGAGPARGALLERAQIYTVADLLRLLPLTFDLSAWYGYVTLLTLFVTVGVAVWGFRVALAGRPLFRDEILEAEAEG